jgi:hypothetical protein
MRETGEWKSSRIPEAAAHKFKENMNGSTNDAISDFHARIIRKCEDNLYTLFFLLCLIRSVFARFVSSRPAILCRFTSFHSSKIFCFQEKRFLRQHELLGATK